MRGLTCASGRDHAELAATRAGRRRAGEAVIVMKTTQGEMDLEKVVVKVNGFRKGIVRRCETVLVELTKTVIVFRFSSRSSLCVRTVFL